MRSPEISVWAHEMAATSNANPNLFMTPVLIFSSNGVKTNVYAHRNYQPRQRRNRPHLRAAFERRGGREDPNCVRRIPFAPPHLVRRSRREDAPRSGHSRVGERPLGARDDYGD